MTQKVKRAFAMIRLESKNLIANFNPRGAAIETLIFKPLNRSLLRACTLHAEPNHYINTIIGPVANRIQDARFSIDDQTHELDANEGSHTLHGGSLGLSEVEWDYNLEDIKTITFARETPDAHMGFPGPSKFKTKYTLDDDRISIEIEAFSKRKNIFNLTPHLYFNLDETQTTSNHIIEINADHYLPVDKNNIPTGKIAPVEETKFDFRTPRKFNQTEIDHNFCLNGHGLRNVMKMCVSDLELSIETDQRGMQVYDARHFDRTHIALEPQGWPNSVNQSNFPSQLYLPSERYSSKIIYKFRRIHE